jgi:transposase-like protein
MAQHFLLSAAARSLSLKAIMKMTDEEARATFQRIRWASNDGQPFCPACGCLAVWAYKNRPHWRCKSCDKMFSVTSGTIFSNRKLPVQDYLAAICLFVNSVKGISALRLGRDLNVQSKTAWLLAHKLREVISTEQAGIELNSTVQVDGCYFNDRTIKQTSDKPKKHVVAVMRQEGGRTLPFVVKKEGDAVAIIRQRVANGSTIFADEARGWDALHGSFETYRVNHKVEYSADGVNVNAAESYFSRLRRLEFGQHHRISGKYLGQYAAEAAWKEDFRREPNGTQWQSIIGMALNHPVSSKWSGYWQRHLHAANT